MSTWFQWQAGKYPESVSMGRSFTIGRCNAGTEPEGRQVRCVLMGCRLNQGGREEIPDSLYVYLYPAVLLQFPLSQFIIDNIAD